MTSAFFKPEASRAWGPRYFSAIMDFSSETYPLTSITSIRSSSGAGMVSRLLATTELARTRHVYAAQKPTSANE